MVIPCGAEQGAWLEQLRLQIPWQSCPNNAVSQGLKCKEIMYVDSLDRGWGWGYGAAAQWRDFPRQIYHCVSLGSWFWLQMRRGRVGLSLSGAVSKILFGYGVLMSGLVLPVCLFLFLFFRKINMR